MAEAVRFEVSRDGELGYSDDQALLDLSNDVFRNADELGAFTMLPLSKDRHVTLVLTQDAKTQATGEIIPAENLIGSLKNIGFSMPETQSHVFLVDAPETTARLAETLDPQKDPDFEDLDGKRLARAWALTLGYGAERIARRFSANDQTLSAQAARQMDAMVRDAVDQTLTRASAERVEAAASELVRLCPYTSSHRMSPR